MKRAAIIQSSYVPWKGYFDMVDRVDELILYDDVQFTKSDWRNRNRIRTRGGVRWLTVPVLHKGRFGQRICDVEVRDSRWAERHWRTLQTEYARAAGFAEAAPAVRELYRRAAGETTLSRINEIFIRGVCQQLGITTRISRSMDHSTHGDRTERLVQLCQAVEANEYLSGPAAKAYLDEGRFAAAGITVQWMDYAGYPEYRQLHGAPFEHRVSALDLLFNEGLERAPRFLRARGSTGLARLVEASC